MNNWDPAALGAITLYSCAYYPILEDIGIEGGKEAAMACEQFSLEYPLFQRNKSGEFPQRDIPHFGKKSSVQCAAIMAAFLVWTQMEAGHPLPTSEILGAARDGYLLWKGEQ